VFTDRGYRRCSDQGVSLLRVVSPGGGEGLNVAVVAGQSVDSGLGANEAELGVLILSELLKMLSDGNGLLDQHVQILGHLGSEAVLLEDSEDLGASDTLNLGDAVRVSKSDADLGGGGALLGQLHNLVNQIVGADLDPGWGSLSVGEASASDTLASGVHSSHFV
jgi:hypothetical protein